MTDVLLPSAKQSTSQESWLSLQVAAPKVASVLKQEAEHCTRLTPLDLWLFARLWLQCFMLIQLLHLNCSSPALAGASHMQTKAKAPPSPPPPRNTHCTQAETPESCAPQGFGCWPGDSLPSDRRSKLLPILWSPWRSCNSDLCTVPIPLGK